MTWIQTASGRSFDLAQPRAQDVTIEDVAHALSLICRFGGHMPKHYSVAQHCVVVSHLVPRENALAGLLHDASEAYVGDVVRPLKRMLPGYRDIEDRVWNAIASRFGIDPTLPASVKEADRIAMFWERRDLLAKPPKDWTDGQCAAMVPAERLIAWTAQDAERAWLHRLRELTWSPA